MKDQHRTVAAAERRPREDRNIALRILLKIAEEILEKVNIVETWRELKARGKKHGTRFFVAALIWEIIEDVVFPFIAWKLGVPGLIPVFLVLHFEPVVYPIFFWAFRTWDRTQGREPWEPNRPAQSSSIRSAAKATLYEVAVAGWYAAILLGNGLSPWILGAYLALMAAFGFVHERIWHDENYGIDRDDSVMPRRVIAKTCTYTVASTMTMGPLLRATFGHNPWSTILACQVTGALLYAAFEAVWAKNRWGITPVPDHTVPGRPATTEPDLRTTTTSEPQATTA